MERVKEEKVIWADFKAAREKGRGARGRQGRGSMLLRNTQT